MHFALPDQLQMEVVKYDASRKAMAKAVEEQNKPKRKKPAYPKGNVFSLGLIPDDIVSDNDMQKAINAINKAQSEDSVHLFRRLVSNNTATELGIELKTKAVLYYYKHLWVSFWLPDNIDDYYYGMSIAFKDNATARKNMKSGFWCNSKSTRSASYSYRTPLYDISDLKETKIGRITWLHKTVFFTKDLIEAGYTREYWKDVDNNHYIKGYGKTSLISSRVNEVATELIKRIPQYKNERSYIDGIWSRVLNNRIDYCLDALYFPFKSDLQLNKSYENTADHWLKAINQSQFAINNSKYRSLVNSNWFRKQLNNMCNLMAESIKSQEHTLCVYKVTQSCSRILHFITQCQDIISIYPNINIDFLISRYDLLVEIEMPTRNQGLIKPSVRLWIEENLSVDSFFNMLTKFHKGRTEDTKDMSDYRYQMSLNAKTGLMSFYWRDFDDTLSMLKDVLDYNEKLLTDRMNGEARTKDKLLEAKPKRWRLQEWHDLLMAENWKIRNKNEDLPQKLFPEPIKVSGLAEDTYTFFQPIDTHQLAHWGQVVRNCVGNTNYSDGIRKYRHIIVLTMINNKPRYTIQLNVDNGVMHVQQIADIANEHLSLDERNSVQACFQEALEIRAKQLG